MFNANKKEYRQHTYVIIIIFIISITIINLLSFSVKSQSVKSHLEEEYYRGKVLSVKDKKGEGYINESIEQKARVKITSGPYNDKIVNLNNLYVKNREHLNIILEKGMNVIVGVDKVEDGVEFFLQDVARDYGLIYLLSAFIILLLIIGRRKGVKTIISLLFTGFILFKVMFPLLLKGYSPILIAIISAIIIIIFIMVVIGGLNTKTLAAIIGTAVGVLIAGLLAYIMGKISYLTGFSSNEAQLLLSGNFNIDIRGLLFAGIIIGSLGAITDVSMSIASTTVEIKEANPLISSKDLMISSFNVGRDIMGTMSNTLILAYVGGSVHLLLALMRFEISWSRIINTDLIATEVVRGLAGSIGLIITIPVTAFVSAELMAKR